MIYHLSHTQNQVVLVQWKQHLLFLLLKKKGFARLFLKFETFKPYQNVPGANQIFGFILKLPQLLATSNFSALLNFYIPMQILDIRQVQIIIAAKNQFFAKGTQVSTIPNFNFLQTFSTLNQRFSYDNSFYAQHYAVIYQTKLKDQFRDFKDKIEFQIFHNLHLKIFPKAKIIPFSLSISMTNRNIVMDFTICY